MNENAVWVILAVIIVAWFLLRNISNRKYRVSPQEGKELLESTKEAILLDVRTRGEYEQVHIPNSILIPLAQLEVEAPKKLKDKDAQILVYCRTGTRSAVAVRTLTKSGYTNVKNIGGIIHWPYKTVSGKK